MNEELLYKISLLEQEAKKLEENIKSINTQVQEFESIKSSLFGLDKELLAGLGKGIYFKSQALENDLLVNIGCNILVKKSREETSKLIDNQIKELEQLKLKLLEHIENLNKEMGNLIGKAQS